MYHVIRFGYRMFNFLRARSRDKTTYHLPDGYRAGIRCAVITVDICNDKSSSVVLEQELLACFHSGSVHLIEKHFI